MSRWGTFRWLVAGGVLAGLLAGGCGGGTAAPTTTSSLVAPAAGTPVDPATRKARAASLLAANDAAFARFAASFRSLGPAATTADLRALALPAASELARTARGVETLRPGAPPATARAITALASRYDTVYQGIESLVAGFGSRGFNLSGWAAAFAQAVSSANTAETNLRHLLGIPTAR